MHNRQNRRLVQDEVRRFLTWTMAMAEKRRFRPEGFTSPALPPVEVLPSTEDSSPPQTHEFETVSQSMQRLIATAKLRGERLAESVQSNWRASERKQAGSAAPGSWSQESEAAIGLGSESSAVSPMRLGSEASAISPIGPSAGSYYQSDVSNNFSPFWAVPGTIQTYRGVEDVASLIKDATKGQAPGGSAHPDERPHGEWQWTDWEERAGSATLENDHDVPSPAAGGSFFARSQPEQSEQPMLPGVAGLQLGQVRAQPAAQPLAVDSWGAAAAFGGGPSPRINRSDRRELLQQKEQLGKLSKGAGYADDFVRISMPSMLGTPEQANDGALSRLAEETRLREMLAEIIRVDALRHGYNLKER